MGDRISYILTLFLAFTLPAALFFETNKVQGWLAVVAQATIVLWPLLTVICLFRMNYQGLTLFKGETSD